MTGASLALVRAHVAQVPLPKQGHVTRLSLSLEEHTAAAVLLKWYTAPHAQVRFKTIKKILPNVPQKIPCFPECVIVGEALLQCSSN